LTRETLLLIKHKVFNDKYHVIEKIEKRIQKRYPTVSEMLLKLPIDEEISLEEFVDTWCEIAKKNDSFDLSFLDFIMIAYLQIELSWI
jgi:hypothetical protein